MNGFPATLSLVLAIGLLWQIRKLILFVSIVHVPSSVKEQGKKSIMLQGKQARSKQIILFLPWSCVFYRL